jgi:flagellar biosynthesis/type III secretory pathway protein FliH
MNANELAGKITRVLAERFSDEEKELTEDDLASAAQATQEAIDEAAEDFYADAATDGEITLAAKQ